jgi:hypothetical protein
MGKMIQQSRLACASFLCLILTWMLLWSLVSSGMNSHPNTWWIKAWVYSSLAAAPIAVLLAIAGLVFDRRKPAALVALLLGILSTLLIVSVGG